MAHSRIENPTLIERFVKLIPLPYPLAALVWSAVLTGPVFDAIAYLTTGATPVSLASLPNALLNFLLPFYLFLMIRYMRLRVVASGSYCPETIGMSAGLSTGLRKTDPDGSRHYLDGNHGNASLSVLRDFGHPAVGPRPDRCQRNYRLPEHPCVINLLLGICHG